MANPQLAVYAGQTNANHNTANTTLFCGLWGVDYVPVTTESLTQTKWFRAISATKLGITIGSSFQGATYNIRQGGVAGNIAVATPAGSNTQTQDTTHTDSVTAGSLTTGGIVGGTDFQTVQATGLQLNSGSVYGQPLAIIGTGGLTATNVVPANATSFRPLVGVGNMNASETPKNVRFPAGTLVGLGANIDANTFNAAITVVARKNSTTSLNNTVTINSSTVTYAQDSTHNDSIASGNFLDAQWSNTAASGAASCYTQCAWFDVVAGGKVLVAGCYPIGTSFATGVTDFMSLAGDQISSGATVETSAEHFAAAAMSWSNLFFRANGAATNTVALTLSTRVAAAGGNQAITIPINNNADGEDTTHNDSITSAQLIDYKVTSSAGSNTVPYVSISSYMLDPTVSTFVPPGQVKKPPPGGGGGKGKGPGQQQFGYLQGPLYISYGAIPRFRIRVLRKLIVGTTAVVTRLKQLLSLGVG